MRRSIGFASTNASTARSLCSIRVSIVGLGGSLRRTCIPPSGPAKSGRTKLRSDGSSTDWPASTVSEIALNPTHAPEKRDRAKPYSPNSRYSRIEAGFSVGMNHAMKATSDWCGIDDDTQP